ncbi:hypothetical protein GH714_010725 [Hevea brasiliensis]|uniref:Uncharacterized protein n=1 Tax=Hevea brasiliensis TaxID=3981 RepID=A0A6A6LQV8_HEVBR|nr:hypothetical protein GH714_010725 [Hevea brasiliensis]
MSIPSFATVYCDGDIIMDEEGYDYCGGSSTVITICRRMDFGNLGDGSVKLECMGLANDDNVNIMFNFIDQIGGMLSIELYVDIFRPNASASDVSNACTQQQEEGQALKYKLGSVASILVAGAFGVSLPFLANKIPTLRPENDIFFMIKAFATGIILANGFIHILPEAFNDLTSGLEQNPCRNFPFTGFVAMMSTIGTLMVDSFTTGFYKRLHFNKNKHANEDEERAEEDEHSGRLHVHTYAIHVMPMVLLPFLRI